MKVLSFYNFIQAIGPNTRIRNSFKDSYFTYYFYPQ